MNKILNCQRGFLSRRKFPFLDNFSQIVRLMGCFVFRFYHNGATYFSKRRSLEACSLFLFSTCKQLHKNQKRLFRTIFQRVFSKLFHLKIEIRKFIYHYDCLSNVLNVLLVSCESFRNWFKPFSNKMSFFRKNLFSFCSHFVFFRERTDVLPLFALFLGEIVFSELKPLRC